MPELPEVETTCRGIQTQLLGKQICKIIIRQPKLRWPVSRQLFKATDLKILEVFRRAKYLLLKTSKGTIIIHLGMSGRLCVVDSNQMPQKHDHLDFQLNNKKILRYTDPRRFGAVLWTTDNPLTHTLLKHLGPEPLSEAFNSKYLFLAIKNKKTTIKQLIMDQMIVVGVGNIYANEALFAAKILPTRLSNTLTIKECSLLVKCTKRILTQAIKVGGTTLKDFLTVDSKPGYFSQKLFVYGRAEQNCLQCHEVLEACTISQRATVFCRKCQV